MDKDSTNYTPDIEENRLGILDKSLLNHYEAEGVVKAEIALLTMETDNDLTIEKLLELHRIAFGQLYNWAGKWRQVEVVVGQLMPPPAHQVPILMYQFIDNLNFQIKLPLNQTEHIELVAHYHHEFVKIHPFHNGNGRLGRMLLNFMTLQLAYEPLELYHREGDARKTYIGSLRAADNGNLELLKTLINNELRML